MGRKLELSRVGSLAGVRVITERIGSDDRLQLIEAKDPNTNPKLTMS